MENYVVSLSIAKKMEEAGWKKEIKFWWAKTKGVRGNWKFHIEDKDCLGWEGAEVYPAPLTDEILEELPGLIGRKSGAVFLAIEKNFSSKKPKYEVKYRRIDNHLTGIPYNDDEHLPNSLGLMWLHLKQNNLLTKR